LYVVPQKAIKGFGTEFREFTSILFRKTEFRFVSLPRNGLERNYENLLPFLFHGMDFFEHFLFRAVVEEEDEEVHYKDF
jgi:hypothetical protein